MNNMPDPTEEADRSVPREAERKALHLKLKQRRE